MTPFFQTSASVSTPSRRANWDHAHSRSACILRLSLLNKPRFAGVCQCFERIRKTRQKQSWKVTLARTRATFVGTRFKLNGTSILADTSLQILQKTTNIHVGDWARSRDSPRQDHLREHDGRHHQLGKSEGAKQIPGSCERSGLVCSKI